MNAPMAADEMFGAILLPKDLSGASAIGGMGVSTFISTSRNDKEVVSFLNHAFYEAAALGASDVHFQDEEYGTLVRYRIGGVLEDRYHLNRLASREIDSKMRSRCQIAQQDRDSAFDGAFWLDLSDCLLDVRVSILPTRLGQSIVCRLLDQRNASRRLSEIDMQPLVREALMTALYEPEGIVLVTGPTGSGKTSTLYACLNELNTREIHIVTAEDPVEYRLAGANQVSVHQSRSFSQILRAFLRQDFDVGLVGEIRDRETATTAYQAANTGHLMLSTLHANDTLTSISRLTGLGVDPYTVSSATKCVIAQRLPQRLCQQCKVPHVIDSLEEKNLDHLKYAGAREFWARNPAGCDLCRGGEAGRMPVIEMLTFTRQLRDALIDGDENLIKTAAQSQPQYTPVGQAALNMSAEGLVSFDRAIALNGT